MDSILYNNGVVIQGMDSSSDNFVLSDVSPHGYSGLERYITWPLENQDDPVSIQLSEEVFKASPRNPRLAHLLASFPSYFTKILVSSSTTACEFLYCLTKNPTAQLHHRNYAVMPYMLFLQYSRFQIKVQVLNQLFVKLYSDFVGVILSLARQ